MANAAVQPAAMFDIELSQQLELPADNGLLRPALTQSLEFDKVRGERAFLSRRARTLVATSAPRGLRGARSERALWSRFALSVHVATQISLRLQLRTRRGDVASRDILRDVSGACFPGMLMAIMGATGSGKTSLMNILARRLVLTKGLHVSGAVLFNGLPRPRNWKSHYVEQHDLLFSELTVHETLHFAAQLRLPTTATPEERAARVDAVVATLGLQAVLHSRVGGDLVRGISGGERKRLALGNDLIVDPPLLFLDEPTSGLDAFNAQSVMSSLKLLASTGRSVVACLHQPRSGITALFDSLLLLSEGRCMYSGPAKEALPFFQRCGFRSPPHTNPSDFYLDVISVSLRSDEAEAASRARVALLADACTSEQPALLQALHAMSRKSGGRGVTEGVSVRILDAADGAALADGPKGDMEADMRHPTTSLLGTLRRRELEWRALSGRAGKLALRQKLENTLNLVRTIIFSTLLGLIWLNVGRKQSGAPADLRNLGGLLFFSIVNHSFSGVFSVVYVFASECRQILRERVAGMYGVLPYFVSRLAVELPRNALWTLLHSVLIYWIVGLRANASAFFIFVAIHVRASQSAKCAFDCADCKLTPRSCW